MIRKALFVAAIALTLSSVLTPQKANALGLINMSCFYGELPTGLLGPHPTVGCTLLWEPGGRSVYADFSVLYECLTQGCVVRPGNFFRSVNIVNPSSGVVHTYLGRNCVGIPVFVAIDGLTKSYRININGSDILDQVDHDTDGGTIPVFCISGAIGAVPP